MKADIAIVGGAGHIGLPLGILFAKKERIMIHEAFQVQWRAYQKLGGSFLKMAISLSKRTLAWFLPVGLRSCLRAAKRKQKKLRL